MGARPAQAVISLEEPALPARPLRRGPCTHFTSSILVIRTWFNSKWLVTGRGEQACPPPRTYLCFRARIQQLPAWSPSAFRLRKGLFPPAAAFGSSGKGRDGSSSGASAGTELGLALPSSHHLFFFFQQRQGGDEIFKGFFSPSTG